MTDRNLRRSRSLFLPALVLLLSAVCMLSVVLDLGQTMVQSSMALPLPVAFAGEYSWDGEHWAALEADTPLPASRNVLYLRGHFTQDIPEGTRFNYYHDHIVAEITVNGTPRLESGTVDWVENAVRHGVTKKEGGCTVRLTTRETADSFTVTVSDTGRGFDPEHYREDGKVHVGIRNVRRRLEYMCGGTLTIVSAPGEGTTAVIALPKNRG